MFVTNERAVMATKVKAAVIVAVLTATVPLLAGCHTTQGAGEDLQAAGKSLSNSADKHTGY
jgi:predicted small secreted protein